MYVPCCPKFSHPLSPAEWQPVSGWLRLVSLPPFPIPTHFHQSQWSLTHFSHPFFEHLIQSRCQIRSFSSQLNTTIIPKIILDAPLRVGIMKACCCVETGFRGCTDSKYCVMPEQELCSSPIS